uniref:Arginine/serine-rich protein 1 n=1 Tax=Cairina moschata TaxID=8855 RepID=A0A8C3D0C1_CAIMO
MAQRPEELGRQTEAFLSRHSPPPPPPPPARRPARPRRPPSGAEASRAPTDSAAQAASGAPAALPSPRPGPSGGAAGREGGGGERRRTAANCPVPSRPAPRPSRPRARSGVRAPSPAAGGSEGAQPAWGALCARAAPRAPRAEDGATARRRTSATSASSGIALCKRLSERGAGRGAGVQYARAPRQPASGRGRVRTAGLGASAGGGFWKLRSGPGPGPQRRVPAGSVWHRTSRCGSEPAGAGVGRRNRAGPGAGCRWCEGRVLPLCARRAGSGAGRAQAAAGGSLRGIARRPAGPCCRGEAARVACGSSGENAFYGMETGYYRTTIKTESDSESICMEEVTVKKTDDMADFMDDLKFSSPKKRYSCLRSERASSRSWSRSRSKSRVRRNSSQRYRRYSRSYSRSRSRSRGYMSYRGRYRARHSRRSRSHSRGRRYYGFGRTVYPEVYRNWRSRSHTRSRSRSPLHLSEKEKRELLEIAKANAAKALGTDNIVLPASLKILTPSKETNNIKQEHEDSGESDEQPRRLTEDRTKSGMERATTQRSISFSPNNTMAKPVLQRPASHVVKEPSISPGREDDKKGSPYGQWVPVKKEEKKTFLNFSPKCALFRAR